VPIGEEAHWPDYLQPRGLHPRYESGGGALIEHSNLVRLGTLSFLTLSIDGQEVSLRCRAVRSAIYRYELRPTGEREHVYRTGLEFSAVSEDARRLLDESLDPLSSLTSFNTDGG